MENMTELLYLRDAYLREFTATVVAGRGNHVRASTNVTPSAWGPNAASNKLSLRGTVTAMTAAPSSMPSRTNGTIEAR